MPQWNLNVTPGGATGGLTAPQIGGAGAQGWGPLMDMLRWKMQMQERAELSRLEQIRQQMNMAKQQIREAKRQRGKAGYKQGLGRADTSKRDEYWKAWRMANALVGPGSQGFSRNPNPNALQNLTGMIGAIGPQAAHEGLMQSGALLGTQRGSPATIGQMRAGGLVRDPATGKWIPQQQTGPSLPRSAAWTTPDIYGESAYRSPYDQPFRASMASMEKGGTVPETGTYKLHEGETVIPKKLSDVLLPSIAASRKSKGKAKKSYQGGTLKQKWLDWLMAKPEDLDQGSIERALEAFGGTAIGGGDIPLPGQWPGGPVEGGGGAVSKALIGAIDPTLEESLALPAAEGAPVPSPEEIASVFQPQPVEPVAAQPPGAMGIPGLSVTEEPLSERGPLPMGQFMGQGEGRPQQVSDIMAGHPGFGGETVKKYTLQGKPETPAEQQQREMDDIQGQIDQHKEQAQSLNTSAMKYQRWAMQNPNKPSSSSLMAMSKEHMANSKQMYALAGAMQKDLEDRRKTATEAEVQRDVAAAEGGAYIRRGQVEAQTAQEKATRKTQEDLMKMELEQMRQEDPDRFQETVLALIFQMNPDLAMILGGPEYGPE